MSEAFRDIDLMLAAGTEPLTPAAPDAHPVVASQAPEPAASSGAYLKSSPVSHGEAMSSSQAETASSSHAEATSSSHAEAASSSHAETASSSRAETTSSSHAEAALSFNAEAAARSHAEAAASSHAERAASWHAEAPSRVHQKAPAVPHQIVDRSGWKGWQVVVTAAAAFAVGGVGIVMSRPLVPTSPHAADLTPSLPRPVEVRLPRAANDADRSGAPKWARIRQSSWATDGSRTVGFELEAENDVRVWMKHVRPVLAVRCLGRRVEAFVITDSATSIESSTDRHTVHVSFDGEAESEERWLDSESKHELFAPDGAALAGQLARAHTMRFGFTPYSASPVVADFDVRGFAQPLESVNRTCSSPSKAKARSVSE